MQFFIIIFSLGAQYYKKMKIIHIMYLTLELPKQYKMTDIYVYNTYI